MADTLAPSSDSAPPIAAKDTKAGTTAAAAAIPNAKGSDQAAWSVTIARPASELFAFWRDFANLATFMENLERIDVIDDHHSHWVVSSPGGGTVEWDAIVTDERKDELLAWVSAEGADIANSGRVEFAEAGGRGTIVTATILYDPPGGTIGKLVAKLFQREPAIQARRDLRRFKQLMETGEIATARMNAAQIKEYGR